jgi:hypothetical protein
MLILRIGLYIAVGMAALATWMSASAGYPIEVAMVRGLLAFMACSLVAYFAELVVMTAPPPAGPVHAAVADDDEDESTPPVSLPAIRSERDSALVDSRAA